jgi:hypothetical protein
VDRRIVGKGGAIVALMIAALPFVIAGLLFAAARALE